MRLQLRLGRPGLLLAMAISVAVAVPRRSSAEVITIDDGGRPGTTELPFTCSVDGPETPLWLPSMGFVYRNVEAFELVPGDTIAFDLQADLGFLPQLDIALAHAPDPQNPFKPDDLPGSDFAIVAHAAVAASPGNRIVGDYELVFTVDTPFRFPGGGLIIRVTNPQGILATKTDLDCLPVITADLQPTGANRLVGTFKLEAGEYPWNVENTTNTPGVPYVRITWTRCGDGVLQPTEECDRSAKPDPFCDSTCHFTAVAKGSGCSAGGGAGLAMALALVILALALRRRAAGLAVLIVALWAGSAQAQARTDGFRVDRFETAPSVDDGLVVQDPGVLRHMAWSVNATLGFTNTLLRVVPTLSSDTGVDVVGPRLSADLDFALGLGDRFELDLAVPFAVVQASESGTAGSIMLRSAGTTAVGDARVGGSALLLGRRTGPRVGLAATVAIPVGSERSFTGDPGAGAEVLAMGGFVEPGYRVIVNGGVRLRHGADYVTSDQGTELVGRAGVFVPVAGNRLTTSLELDAMARASGRDAYKELGSPILALVGARYHFPGGLHAGAGIGMGLTEAPGSPAVRALITVGYSPEPGRPKPAPAPGPAPGPGTVDSDGDRIPDTLDKCPSQPEDENGFQDDDGCPDGPPEPGKPLTLEDVVTLPAPIEFKFDTAIMLPGAEVYLNQVLEILQKHPEVQKLEIQGHTSSEGGAEYNLRLSNDRARAVFTWLVDHGIDAQRLVPHGYGLTQPLVPNDSEPNRQRNRRVQFRLLEQTPGSKPIGSQPPATQPPTTPRLR